jgi:hypothetical protein
VLSVCIDTVQEEEPAVLSARERGFTMHKFNRWPEVTGRAIGNNGSTFKGSPRAGVIKLFVAPHWFFS